MSEKEICTECELRHRKQDNDSDLLLELYKAIIGDITNPEEMGLCTKINLLYKDFESRKNLLKSILITSFTSIVGLIFWCGYQYHVLTVHTEQIQKLENQIIEIQRELRK